MKKQLAAALLAFATPVGCRAVEKAPKTIPSLRGIVRLPVWLELDDDDTYQSGARELFEVMKEECRRHAPGLELGDSHQDNPEVDEWAFSLVLEGNPHLEVPLSGQLHVYKVARDEDGRLCFYVAHRHKLCIEEGSWTERVEKFRRGVRDFAITWRRHQHEEQGWWTDVDPPEFEPSADAWLRRIQLLEEDMTFEEVHDLMLPYSPDWMGSKGVFFQREYMPEPLFPERWPRFRERYKSGEEKVEYYCGVSRDGKCVGGLHFVFKDGRFIGVCSNNPEKLLGAPKE